MHKHTHTHIKHPAPIYIYIEYYLIFGVLSLFVFLRVWNPQPFSPSCGQIIWNSVTIAPNELFNDSKQQSIDKHPPNALALSLSLSLWHSSKLMWFSNDESICWMCVRTPARPLARSFTHKEWQETTALNEQWTEVWMCRCVRCSHFELKWTHRCAYLHLRLRWIYNSSLASKPIVDLKLLKITWEAGFCSVARYYSLFSILPLPLSLRFVLFKTKTNNHLKFNLALEMWATMWKTPMLTWL